MLLQPIPGPTYSYQQLYNVTFSAAPQVLIAMRNLAIDYTNQSIDFTVVINNSLTTSTRFTTIVTAPNNLSLTLMYYMYIAIDPTYSYTYFLYFSEDLTQQLNGSLSLNTTIIKNINNTITQFSLAQVVSFVISFAMGANSYEYSVAATGSMTSSS